MVVQIIVLLVSIAVSLNFNTACRHDRRSVNIKLLQHKTSSTMINNHHNGISRLYARVSKTEEEVKQMSSSGQTPSPGDMISLPYPGLAGFIPNNMFYEPIDISDPLKNTDDLPGEDGSEEKISAILQRIQQRVEQLQVTGEWDDEGSEFGSDPLAKQPIWQTMAMQIQSCRPFETIDDLALTYVLVVTATLFIMAYLVFLMTSLDAVVGWYVNTDFDADFISNLFNSK